MRFSIWPSNQRPFADTLAVVQACEGFGWHAAYYADHFMPNGADATPLRGDVLEAMVTLGGLAAATTSIRLGTLVASATYRHPAVAAKMFATLDEMSRGRAIVGLGAGWQENEHASYGIELGTIPERIDRFEEYVEVVHSLLSEESTTVDGRYYRITDGPLDPRPSPPPPLLLGVRGERRTMGLAARYADVWNAWTSPEDHRRLNGVLDEHCERIGRDPRQIARTTQAMVMISTDEEWLGRHRGGPAGSAVVGTPNEVLDVMSEYAAAGCDEFIVPGFLLGDAARAVDTLTLFNDEVARQLA
jgi:F420-dependent oxidoreductase-like protein